MTIYELNLDIMETEFFRRYQENQGKQIDNSSLPAGSNMYYYCHGCGILVATKPEGWFMNPPPRYCAACRILMDHGLLDRLYCEAKEKSVVAEHNC
jgi:hypothetical protein